MAFLTFQPLKIGAGGFITSICIAPDGTKVIRNDTYGAHLWDGAKWSQLVTTTALGPLDSGFDSNSDPMADGAYEVVVAPTLTTRIYLYYNGYVYISNNSGLSFTRTAFSRVTAAGNNMNTKVFGPYIAVDPANADVLYVGTPGSGLFVSIDAGASWNVVAAVGTGSAAGAGQNGGHLIAFDPSSSVTGGQTQGVYVSTYGTGVYHTANAGSSWTLTTSTPTLHSHLICASDGVVYLTVRDTTDNLKIYNGTWSSKSVGSVGNQLVSVAVDPSSVNKITCANAAGALSYSTDHAATWTGFDNLASDITYSASDMPWQAATSEPFKSTGQIAYDPSASNKLYATQGIGVFYTSPSTGVSSGFVYTSQSVGIEQLVANMVLSPPGGEILCAGWDRPFFYKTRVLRDTYATGHGPNYDNAIVMGHSIDYASSNPLCIVGLFNFFGGVEESGFSTNGGQNWTNFANTAYFNTEGGCIAAASPTNILIVESNNGNPWYTKNQGTSWTQISLPGVPTSVETGWGFSSVLDRQIACADRVDANTFYLYNYGPSGHSSVEGIWKSTDSGDTWSHASTPGFASSGFNAQLISVPGNAGHLFFTAGDVGGSISGNLSRSTDHGATWSSVANVLEAKCVGFGAIAAGQTYPTVWIAGWVSNVWGIWRSKDNCSTWEQMGDFPLGYFDIFKCISGDSANPDVCYIGFAGSGWVYGTTGRRSGLRLGLHG